MPTIVLPAAPPPPPPVPGPVARPTLADVERATAARLGPFFHLRATGGGPDTVTVEGLRSALPQGGYEDLYLLRRAATQAADRVAQVVAFDAPTGGLRVDRAYRDSVPPAGEDVELHHLHPAALRRAVRQGVARCWLRDAVPLENPPAPAAPLVPATGPVDLTGVAPWLALPEQVLDVVRTDTLAPVLGWSALQQGGRVYLVLGAGRSNLTPGVTVLGRRSQFTYVNSALPPDGPVADADVLLGPLSYLAAASHCEAWQVDRDKLEAASAEQRMPTQKEAAEAFTREAVATCPWLFQPGGRYGGRGPGRFAPLWGVPGAGGAASPLDAAWVNGPAGTAPAVGG